MIISFILPVFNEAENINEIHRRIAGVRPDETEWEIIFIDDGSTDESLRIICDLIETDKRVKCVKLSRNFGQHPAIVAGLNDCRGDLAVIMDSDLQDEPSAIIKMLDKQKQGYDIVYAVREKRKEGLVKRTCFNLFHKIMGRLSDIPIPENAGVFSVINRRVIDKIVSFPETRFYLPGIRAFVGYKSAGVTVERNERKAGESKSFGQLYRLAKTSIFSFSFFPLKLISYITFLDFLVGALLAVYILLMKLFFNAISGWASLAFILIFFNFLQFLCLMIVSEYLAIIFDEVKSRPKYVIEDKINF